MATVVVTGGAGYIGSHVVVALLEAGHEAIVVDDLSNASPVVLDRIAEITGSRPVFHRVDVTEPEALDTVFGSHAVDAVVHLAGLKSVAESVADPLRYWQVNVGGAVTLLQTMRRHGVRRLVFSSSATVYGDPERVPIDERAPVRPVNPYGATKATIERILDDLAGSEPGWHLLSLRYFNPMGAHPSGRIGEDPSGIPNNLVPYVLQVAVGRLPRLRVFGDDYPTPDGTGVRDYIHVMDLAEGHLAALDALDGVDGHEVVNLGTGHGYSVFDVVKALEAASGRPIPYEVVDRRPGDVAVSYADPSRALRRLGWRASRGLDDMAADAWRWQVDNPEGYPADR